MAVHKRVSSCPGQWRKWLVGLSLLTALTVLGLLPTLHETAALADLLVPQVEFDKTVDRQQAAVGEHLTYTVVITNVGVTTASIRITDANPNPPYTRILTATITGGDWISRTDVISWDGQLAPAGGVHTLSFNLLVQGYPHNGKVTNRAYASDLDAPGTLPIANDLTVTAITCSTYLPLLYRGYCSAPDSPSSFGLEIAALHEFRRQAAGQARFETEQYPSLVAALADSGASWARLRILWSELEPQNTTPGNYAGWNYYDGKLARVIGSGVHPIITIADNPGWAATTRCGPIDLVPLSEFTEMLAAVVQRYSAPPYNIHYWELYNEPDGTWPDGSGGLGCWGDYADEYVELLAQAYPVIKTNDPQAQVLLGGIAYDWFTEYGGPFNRQFIDDVLAAGGANYFDLMNFHYFPDFHCEWDEQYGYQYGRDIIAKANYIRQRLGLYGVEKPVVCTELAEHGYLDDPPNWHYPVSSLQKQARYVVQGYVRALAVGLPVTIWYALDTPAYDSYAQGLLFADLSPKPAYSAYQVLTQELAHATYLCPFVSADPNVEGYVFRIPCPGSDKAVLWTNPVPNPPGADPCLPDTQFVDAEAQVAFPVYTDLQVVTWDGSSQTVPDGGTGDLDGSVNGYVTILVTGEPAYVSANP